MKFTSRFGITRVGVASLGLMSLVSMTIPAAPESSASSAEEPAPASTPIAGVPEVLIVVNGDSITSADLDAQLIDTHRRFDEGDRSSFDYRRLLTKLVNDRLLVQEAESIGMDREPEMRDALGEIHSKEAIRAYVNDARPEPDSVTEEEIRAYFNEYYWQIRLRQISVRTPEEALRRIEEVRAGADMESLAKAISLDHLRARGGLTNLLYWADVEIPMREASRDLKAGEISAPYPRNEAFSFLRVEERLPVDEAAFESVRATIRGRLAAGKAEAAWKAFTDARVAEVDIRVNQQILDQIAAEIAGEAKGGFGTGGEDLVLWVDGGPSVTDGELRRAISHGALQDGSASFETVFARAVRQEKANLALAEAARKDGWFDHPSVMAAYTTQRDQRLIEAYLEEIVVPKIKIQRADLESFYQEHKGDFKGPDEVQLSTLVFSELELAQEASRRLQNGADFDYISRQYDQGGVEDKEEIPWTPVTVFSETVRTALDEIEVGGTTAPIAIPMGWTLFKLQGRRPAEPPSLAEAEMQIRQMVFQRKFNEALDEHLAVLKRVSEIEHNEPAIERYFGGGS